jgi:hypothetical protein
LVQMPRLANRMLRGSMLMNQLSWQVWLEDWYCENGLTYFDCNTSTYIYILYIYIIIYHIYIIIYHIYISLYIIDSHIVSNTFAHVMSCCIDLAVHGLGIAWAHAIDCVQPEPWAESAHVHIWDL